MLPFSGGQPMRLSEVVEQVRAAANQHRIEGITLLGGEPLAHAPEAAALARQARGLGLSVMIFSGYTLAEAREFPDRAVADLLSLTDILVDGPYIRELPDVQRRWIGSTNQVIHFMTGRYRADDPCWQMPNTLEIRLADGAVSVNGFPAPAAVGLWKRPSKLSAVSHQPAAKTV